MSNDICFDYNSAVKLLSVFTDFYQAKSKKEDIELVGAADKIAGAFGIEEPEVFIEGLVQNQLGDAFNTKGAAEMAGVVASMYKPVLQLAGDFAKGGMKPQALYEGINGIYCDNLKGVEGALESALGFDFSDETKALLGQYELVVVSLYCFAAAYKIYRKAADDAAIARERRIEIERLCAEAAVQLKAHRTEMETLVNSYMLDRLEPFACGVSAMDDAILTDDDDGYIAANAEIWSLFGREGQYRNTEEFNDLMLSDDTFKL